MREILNLFDIGIVLNKCLSKIIFSIVLFAMSAVAILFSYM